MVDLINRLSELEAAAVADVMVAMGLTCQVLSPELKALGNECIYGRALCAAGQEGTDEPVIPTYELDQAVAPGDIVIIASQGYRKGALIGDNMVTSMIRRGAKGFILDSGVRDAKELAAGAVPVYCTYASPINGHRFWSYTAIGDAVTLPGIWGPVRIHPGDYILGDRDGVCVLPAAHAGQIITDTVIHMASEAQIKKAIENGEPRDQATQGRQRLKHVKALSGDAVNVDD